jgi:signal peptidase
MLEKIKALYYSKSFLGGLLRDVLSVIALFAVLLLISQIVLGLWVPMVSVESGSMIPHIQIGDIIIEESADRKEVITYSEGKQKGYTSFDDYGDVILYRPYGRENATPIIHRAMFFVEKGKPMWDGGPPAPHAGYITKGDNSITNPSYDQKGSISYQQPVKKEWVVGIARFVRIPVLGCIPLLQRGNLACFK